MALFLGEGRLILNGGRNQQISDCEFSGDAELVLNGTLMAQVERIQRVDGPERVIDTIGGFDLMVHSVYGAIRMSGGERFTLSDINGDVFSTGVDNLDASGMKGTFHANGGNRLRVQMNGSATFSGTADCEAVVDGTLELDGVLHMKVRLRSVGEDRGLIADGCLDVDADVMVAEPDGHGVEITGTNDMTLRGSVDSAGQGAGTFNNVHITGESEAVRVTGLRSRGGNSANVGVFIDEDCTDCIVDGVDFGAAADYGTDDLVDNGTNTRIGTNWSL